MVEFCFLAFFFISYPNNDTMSLNQKNAHNRSISLLTSGKN